MPRPPRIENPDTVFHVYSRGNYRSPIFNDEGASRAFYQAMHETVGRAGWDVSAYAIMPNHFHMMIRAPRANLARGMQIMLSSYAIRFNRFRKEHGHVFQGRYHAKHVPSGMDAGRVMDYVHLNHVRKGLLSIEELGGSWLSSLSALIRPEHRRGLGVGEALVRYCGYQDTPEGRMAYVEHLRRIYLQDPEAKLYEAEFKALTKAEKVAAARHAPSMAIPAPIPPEKAALLDQAHSDAMFAVLLKSEGKTEADALLEAGMAEWKLNLAMGMQKSTTVSVRWLADRLHVGSCEYFSALLQKRGQTTIW